MKSLLTTLSLSLLLATHALAQAPTVIKGPVHVEVVRVIDGDTFVVHAYVWLGLTQTVHVRIADFDAPEDDPISTQRLIRALADDKIILRDVRYGKYAKRVIADVYLINPDGTETNLTNLLL